MVKARRATWVPDGTCDILLAGEPCGQIVLAAAKTQALTLPLPFHLPPATFDLIDSEKSAAPFSEHLWF